MRRILHLMPADAWERLGPAEPVSNQSLETEGFIHCTDEPSVLINVANAFYRAEPGDFVVVHIDPDRLRSRCVWESPAHVTATDESFAPSFPHVYGPIDREAIVGAQRVIRSDDGRFVGYASPSP